MKFLVLLIVILVAVMLWRSGRRGSQAPRQENAARPAAAGPQDMVQCAHCPVHLPRADALEGRDGRPYCSAEHRRLAGG